MARNIISPRSPQMPVGTEVAAFRTHEEATAAVERLAEDGFPLSAITIVGSDLHLSEHILGRMTPGKVALSGATQGLAWGILMAVFSMLFYPTTSFIIPLVLVCAGVLMGMIITTVVWALSKSRGNFAVQSSMVATRYTVLVSEMPDRAFKLLTGMAGNLTGQPRRPARRDEPALTHQQGRGGRERSATAPASEAGPTEYGSRPDEVPRFGVRLSDRSATSPTTRERREEVGVTVAEGSTESKLSPPAVTDAVPDQTEGRD